MIPFNKPLVTENEEKYLKEAILNRKFSGDGEFTKKCNKWFESNYNCKKILFTTSGTSALEMSAILCGIQEGDEVLMPSFTFVSTANAFVLRGAKIIFVDVNPQTMNIDESLIEQAITKKTKVIVPVHYGGVSCEMDKINKLAKKYNLFVVEDAAQGIEAFYNNLPLGTIGNIGCFSFHETKNITMGEGGAILLNDEKLIERAEIIREKGTNRSKFFRGQIDKYTWVDIGSSFLPSELNMAYLYGQLEFIKEVTKNRVESFNYYHKLLKNLEIESKIKLPFIPENCKHNGHLFYIKTENIEIRQQLIEFLKKYEIYSVFHYIPLHSSPAGLKYGEFNGNDNYTTTESEKLLRLPMFYGLKKEEIEYICEKIYEFYKR